MTFTSDLRAINFSTSSAVYRWRPAAWLCVTGEDAESFLQGQFTNDLRGLVGRGGAVYGLWLDVKGKVLADSFILHGGGEGAAAKFWLGSYFSPAAVIRARLESHIIADDVVVEDATDAWAGVALLGSGAAGWLAEKRDALLPGFPGMVFRGRRTGGDDGEWIFPVAAIEAVRQQTAGLPELESSEMERRRIMARIPAIPADIGPGDLPNEGGLEAEAISYTKGCYLGQEVMARLKSMGKVRRRLLRVKGAVAELPPLPAPLFLGGRRLGELRSAVAGESDGFSGLAMLSLLHLTPGAGLALAADAAPSVQLDDEP